MNRDPETGMAITNAPVKGFLWAALFPAQVRLVRLLDSPYLGLGLASESFPVLRLRRQRNSLSHLVQ